VLWIASNRRRDYRERGRHGLHETVRAGFTERREHEDVQIPQRDLGKLSGSRKLYRCREIQGGYETLQFVALRPLAPDDETNLRPAVWDHGHRMKELDQTLLRPEIAQRSYHEPGVIARPSHARRESAKIDSVRNNGQPLSANTANLQAPFSYRLGVHVDVSGKPEAKIVYGLLGRRPEVAQGSLGPNDCPHAGEPSRRKRGADG